MCARYLGRALCRSAHICRTARNGLICINEYRLCEPTDRRSLDHRVLSLSLALSHSLLFHLFIPLFLLISTVPLTIPVPYKGTQFRRAELFQSLSKRHSVPFIVHIHTRCIVAFTTRRSTLYPANPPPRPLLPLFRNPGPLVPPLPS